MRAGGILCERPVKDAKAPDDSGRFAGGGWDRARGRASGATTRVEVTSAFTLSQLIYLQTQVFCDASCFISQRNGEKKRRLPSEATDP